MTCSSSPPIVPRTPLYSSIVQLLGAQKTTSRKAAIKARLSTSPEMQGAQLFIQFRKVELTKQMRAAGDLQHTRLIDAMQKPEPNMDWIVEQLETQYQTLSAELLKVDPAFMFCPIATTGNRERATINDCISKAFTIQQQQHRFVWLKPIHVKGMTLSPGSVDSIYKRHEMFGSYFVIGAPAMLTQNICCKRNLANGTEGAYHSLVLSELEDARHIQDRILNTQPGEDIFLRYPPQFIYVIITGSDPKNFENLTRIKDETVIPIGESFKGNKVKACVQENSGSTEINSTCHGIDNRFSITMHKLQGKTIHRLCADLNDHSFRPTIDFHGLFITLSRVKNLKHFARLPYQPDQDNLGHFRNLKPPKNLSIWLQSYAADGHFNKDLLRAAEMEQSKEKCKRSKTTASPTTMVPPPKK